MGPHDKKTTFPAEFCDECYTIHSYTKKNYIQAKEFKKKMIFRFKMAAQLPIFISRHFDFGENLKKKKSIKFGS